MQRTDANNTALAIVFIALAIMLIAGLMVTATQQAAFADRGGVSKVAECHIPPGNPDNRHVIITGEPSVESHVTEHGDFIGPCDPTP